MAAEPGETMRLDRFLWFARIAKTRPFAQALAESGHCRIDGRSVARAAAPVRAGNVLTFADHRGTVRAIRIDALPPRRGPPAEARLCYVELANVSQEARGD
jgi:ribosome-associated heat shock protein Hsp15